MDAMSSKWRDDPVRAINEKKKARANAEEARSIAQSRAKELLEQKLSQAQKAGDARDLEQVGSLDHDAAYRLVRCTVCARDWEYSRERGGVIMVVVP